MTITSPPKLAIYDIQLQALADTRKLAERGVRVVVVHRQLGVKCSQGTREYSLEGGGRVYTWISVCLTSSG